MGSDRAIHWRTKVTLLATNALARLARPRRPEKSDESSAGRAKRILVIELWNIGDVILAMPFLGSLRMRFPKASITLLARPFARDLLGESGLVDDFMAADLDWGYGWRLGWPYRAGRVLKIAREVRRRHFDVVFSARGHLRERVLVALSGARRRVGLSLGSGDNALTDAIPMPSHKSQQVDGWMALLRPFGGAASSRPLPVLRVSDKDRVWARGYLLSRGVLNDGVVIGIHPGASLPEKRWPLDRFREIAQAYASTPGFNVLVFAEPPPSNYGSELFNTRGVIPAQTGLRQLVALIERCDVLVCNDSGPMHIAGALSVPTVAMFGSGIVDWFRPLGEGHELLQSESTADDIRLPSGHPAVRSPSGINVSQVQDAVGRVVQRLKARPKLSST